MTVGPTAAATPPAYGATIVVAALSARPLAESARQGGWNVVSLDLFGDLDTRRASVHWESIGASAGLHIDAGALAAALARAAAREGVVGWVPGSGFEQSPELLAAGGAALPCLGMAPQTVARVRDVGTFFATLDRLGLPHPDVSREPPRPAQGWLAKQARGSGGSHVRPAAAIIDRMACGAGELDDDLYFQREQGGQPMSALFLADGRRGVIVALNRLRVQVQGAHRFVYAGAHGPVRDPELEARIGAALDALVGEFGLRGLGSLDFILDDARQPWLLEVNPRPSSTLALHGDAWPGGLLRAHVDAVRGRLPAHPPRRRPGVRGARIVFAEQDYLVEAALSQALATSPRCHDVPAADSRFLRGEPVCTVSAEGASDADALRVLQSRASLVLSRLTPLPNPRPVEATP